MYHKRRYQVQRGRMQKRWDETDDPRWFKTKDEAWAAWREAQLPEPEAEPEPSERAVTMYKRGKFGRVEAKVFDHPGEAPGGWFDNPADAEAAGPKKPKKPKKPRGKKAAPEPDSKEPPAAA